MAKQQGFQYSPNKKTKHHKHAKSQTTFNKGAKSYIKQYRGQGR